MILCKVGQKGIGGIVLAALLVLSACAPSPTSTPIDPLPTMRVSATPSAIGRDTLTPSSLPAGQETPAPYLRVPADYSTIQAAIDAAQDGETVVVSPGIYQENVDFGGKNITVRSLDPEDESIVATTIIDGGRDGSVVTFQSKETREAVLTGFTITQGSGNLYLLSTVLEKGETKQFCGRGLFGSPEETRRCGGGIVIEGASPTVRGNLITGNVVSHGGGGIFVSSASSPSIEDNVISDNQAAGGGAIFVTAHSSPLIEGNTIRDQRADNGGGMLVEWGSSPTILDNVIDDNIGLTAGGIIVFNNASATIEGNSISGNHSSGGGGGIFVGASASAAIEGNIISNNEAAFGGGVFVEIGSSVTVADNMITQNVVGAYGGGREVSGGCTAEVLDNTIRGNKAYLGGGISLMATGFTTIKGNTISENKADFGAGIHGREEALAVVVGNAFEDNVAQEEGGAIWASGDSRFILRDPDDNFYAGNRPDDVFLDAEE